MNIKYPDYTKSILNLANSILKHYGVEPYHPTLKALDSYLDRNYKNVVVMVLDGMGVRNLENALPDGGFFSDHLVAELTSVLPPTTTAATTTLQSGLSPAEHGWLGWNLYFPEAGSNVSIFPNTNELGEPAASYRLAETHMPYDSIVKQLRKKGIDAHSVSAYGTDRVDSFEEMLDVAAQLCQTEGDSYIYAYWTEPDHTMHETGVESPQTKEWLERLDAGAERFYKSVKDTLLIVTADHGQIDIEPDCLLSHPALVDTLERMPAIESRCAAFKVRAGMEEAFEKEFHRAYGKDFLLFTKNEVMERRLFGPGTPNGRFEGFIGDYLAVAAGPRTIYNTWEQCQMFVGSHAGLTEGEVTVPLVIAD